MNAEDPKLLEGRLQSWAVARWDDVLRREHGNSLQNLGFHKPLGSFGVSVEHLMSPGGLVSLWRPLLRPIFRAKVRRDMGVIADGKSAPGMLWVYMTHSQSLYELLELRRDVLFEAGWEGDGTHGSFHRSPARLMDFIQKTRTTRVLPNTDLYDLIADCYGDKLNPGRTDIFPGVPKQVVLDAFRSYHGFPDDVEAAYFPKAVMS